MTSAMIENESKIDLGVLGYMELLDSMGDDLSIVNAARVSFNKSSEELEEKDKKLILYLAKHKHWTPFEQNSIKFRVKCPIFIARQWMKHRCWVFNEISARYTKFDNTVYIPDTFREQSEDNRQASIDPRTINQDQARKIYEDTVKSALDAYYKLLDQGVCREQARGILPVGSHTEFITTVNFRNYMHWYGLRIHSGAQWEIQQYAKASMQLVKKIFPIAVECFDELGLIRG
jgi:thymidylate synthase (FAD)